MECIAMDLSALVRGSLAEVEARDSPEAGAGGEEYGDRIKISGREIYAKWKRISI
jgi:hypothetical protein